MVSNVKLYSKLDILETELRVQLMPHLKNAAAGRNGYIFCVKQFNKKPSLKVQTDKLTEELVETGAQILSLRAKLGEPTEGTIAERICWYCREWCKIENHNNTLGANLAKRFLVELTSDIDVEQ